MTRFYKMRGIDDGRPSPGYVTWDARDQPDYAGTYAAGLVGSLVPNSIVVQNEFDAPSLVTLYEVDFTTLANQTLGDAGSTPTIDGRTWYQVGQAAGVPTHSEIINGTGLVVTSNGSTGTYRLGIRLADLDPEISDNPRSQKYEVWTIADRTGSPGPSAVFGTIIGDSTNTPLYLYCTGFQGSTPNLDFHSFGTGFSEHAVAPSNAHDVFHLSMDNRHGFTGRYGDSVSGEFPDFSALSYMTSNSGRIDAASLGVLAAGVYANNVSGAVMTYKRMKVVKISGA